MKCKKKPKKPTPQTSKQNISSQGLPEICEDHPQFVKLAKIVRKTVKEDQKLGILFMINPILAMKEIAPELSDSMKKRVEKTISKSRLNKGEEKLFKKVKQGKISIPWVQKVTFRKDKIADLIGE